MVKLYKNADIIQNLSISKFFLNLAIVCQACGLCFSVVVFCYNIISFKTQKFIYFTAILYGVSGKFLLKLGLIFLACFILFFIATRDDHINIFYGGILVVLAGCFMIVCGLMTINEMDISGFSTKYFDDLMKGKDKNRRIRSIRPFFSGSGSES